MIVWWQKRDISLAHDVRIKMTKTVKPVSLDVLTNHGRNMCFRHKKCVWSYYDLDF